MVIYPGNIKDWIDYHTLETESIGKYTNIYIDKDLDTLFESKPNFKYMDGFSPNLNKYLHIGHLSNMILAKSIKSLGICEKIISIYGDTLSGISKEDSLSKLKEFQKTFDYEPELEFFASEVKYEGDKLKDGVGEYEGTKIFQFEDEKIVGIKSDGSSSYFYQDMALADKLNDKTLYLTGNEQNNHFNLLSKFYPNVNHIGLGLVKIDGKKMSSSLGNVVFAQDFIDELFNSFNDSKLVYNVIAGFILKNTPENDKNITLSSIDNPKNSPGLYLSYTMASLKSAGCEIENINKFSSKYLEHSYLKSKFTIKPNVLFNELVEHCKEINSLYQKHMIKGNEENKKMFENKLNDLALGLKLLGLFEIDKV